MLVLPVPAQEYGVIRHHDRQKQVGEDSCWKSRDTQVGNNVSQQN